MSKKEKKEKVVYVDDGSPVADMSGLSGGKRLRNTGGSSAKDKWNTYWDAVKMMFMPMLCVICGLIIIYMLMYLLFLLM